MPAWEMPLAFVFAGALALVGTRLGDWLLSRIGLAASAERTVAGGAIGLGAISHFTFAIGLGGGIGRWLPIALIAAAIPLLPRPLAWARRNPIVAIAVLLLLPLALLAMQPPHAWDATTYHLPFARAYAESGRIAPVTTLRYPVFPQLEEMLFTLGFALAGPTAAALVELTFAALTAAALWAWGRRWFSPRAGVAAAALWLAQPMIVFLATTAYIDIGLCCFVTLTVLCAATAFETRDDRWWWAAGLLAGFGASCKYLGLPFAAGAGLATLISRRPRGIAGFAALAALAGVPWYVYNWHHTGNPLFPFAAKIFGSYGFWDAGDLQAQLDEMRGHGAGRSLGALLLLPWRLTVAQERFQVEAPFLRVLLPALLIATWGALRDRRVRPLLAVAVGYGLFWFGSIQILRYLVPGSALLCLAIAGSLAPLLERLRPRLAALALAVLLAPSLFYAWQRVFRDGVPLRAESRRAWLAERIPGFAAIDRLSREHPGYRAYQLGLEPLKLFGTLKGEWFGAERYRQIYEVLWSPAPALADRLHALGVDWLVTKANETPSDPRFERVIATPTANVYRVPGS